MIQKSSLLMVFLLIVVFTSPGLAAKRVYIQEKSGYTTTTTPVSSKEVFTRHQFREGDFSAWLALVYRAQAFEQFQQLVEERKISTRGLVLAQDIVSGEAIAEVGTILTPEWLYTNMSHSYDETQILTALKACGALDNFGFVIGITGERNIDFSATDFSVILPKIMKISLPIKNEIITKAILNELYSLIVTQHREIEVTSQQSTDYRSRNDNLFMGLLESIGGNILAKTFSPDKTTVTRTAFSYASRVNVPSYYNLRVGFAPYPGFGAHPGIWGINGKKDSLEISFNTFSTPKFQHLHADISYKFIPKLIPYTNDFGFNMIKAVYSQYKLNSNSINNLYVFFPYISGGSAANTDLANGLSTHLGIGVGYSRSTERNNLGFAFDFGMDIPILHWLTFDTGIVYGFQPQSDKTNVWDRCELNFGLNLGLASQFSAQLGYKIVGSTTDDGDNEIYFGIKSVF